MVALRVFGCVVLLMLLFSSCDKTNSSESHDTKSLHGSNKTIRLVENESSSIDTGAEGGFGVYAVESKNSSIRFSIPADKELDSITKINEYKKNVDKYNQEHRQPLTPGVTYASVEIDNREGAKDLQVFKVCIVTDAGDTIEFERVAMVIGEWQNCIGINDNTALYNEGVELYNENIGSLMCLPGAKSHGFMAVACEVDSIRYVYLYEDFLSEKEQMLKVQ